METTIGERIAMVRKSQDYTLEKFGEAIGIKKGSVSLLERGINTPADRTIFMICNRFHVSEQWLRTGEGDMFEGLTPSEEIESFLSTLAIAGDENFKKRLILYLAQVNYPRPKGHGLVTAQSYERFTPPTFNPNRYCYLKWRYIIGWLTAPFVAEFTLLQLY